MPHPVRWWHEQTARVRLAVAILISVGFGWPSTAVAQALGFPVFEQVMLALSWLAPGLTALDLLYTAQVKADQDVEKE